MLSAFQSLAALNGGDKLISLVNTHQDIIDTFDRRDGYREPSRTYEALCDFAEHHELRSVRTRRALEGLKGNATSHARRYAFGVLLRELQRLRFVEPQDALVIVQAGDVVAPEQEVMTQTTFKMWIVDESIWRPRKQWSDGRSFDDTVEVFTAVFQGDWREAASSPALAIYASEDLAAASEVMWENHRLVLMASDWYSMWYAGVTVTTNPFRVGRPAFKRMIEDIGVVRPKSQGLSLTSFDGIFLQIRGASEQNADDETAARAYDSTPSLNRCELIQSLVRIADMTYLKTNESPSLAEALHKLLTDNLAPVISSTFNYVLARPHLYSTAFRRCCCYTRDCSAIIEDNLPTVKGLFERYCLSEKDGADAGLRGSMSYEEFNRFIKDFGLNDHIFTPRESTLAFVWSRMRVIDDGRSKRGRLHLFNLSLECFFEVLVRIAMMKSLPTDLELGYAEHEDAGSFFADLGQKPDELRAWREEHRSLWDVDWEDKDYDPRQPASRALAHLLELLVYSVEALVFEMDNPGKKLWQLANPKFDACVQLSSRKIDKWCKEKQAKDK